MIIRLTFAYLLISISLSVNDGCCQLNSNTETTNSSYTLSGLVDTYIALDTNDPYTQTRPYTTQALYADQASVNLAMIEAKLSQDNLRGIIALQTGDSVKSNYAGEEHRFWRYMQQANIGTKISDDLWIDGGIYLAHVGIESFNSRDNWNYTRSMVAEFSPYYETGAKLTYQVADSLTMQTHLLHGWQNISSTAKPMYGIQLNYAVDGVSQLTYANYLGEHAGGYRNFHDFIAKRDLTNNWSIAAQFDFGTQERDNKSSAGWHGWALLTKYQLTSQLSVAGRVEHFYDPQQVVVSTLTDKSFNLTGLSVNLDYEITKRLLWRSEYRTFIGKNDIFPKDSPERYTSNDSLIVTSLTYSFDIGEPHVN